jgi:hypothetical protein
LRNESLPDEAEPNTILHLVYLRPDGQNKFGRPKQM